MQPSGISNRDEKRKGAAKKRALGLRGGENLAAEMGIGQNQFGNSDWKQMIGAIKEISKKKMMIEGLLLTWRNWGKGS